MIDRKQMYVVPQDKWAALKLRVHFVQWCQNSFLQLNIRTCWSISNVSVVRGQAVECPDKYKYLVMFTDDSFDHKVEDLQEMTSYIVYITYSQPHFSATCLCFKYEPPEHKIFPLVAFMIQSQMFVPLSINPNQKKNRGKSVTDAFRRC